MRLSSYVKLQVVLLWLLLKQFFLWVMQWAFFQVHCIMCNLSLPSSGRESQNYSTHLAVLPLINWLSAIPRSDSGLRSDSRHESRVSSASVVWCNLPYLNFVAPNTKECLIQWDHPLLRFLDPKERIPRLLSMSKESSGASFDTTWLQSSNFTISRWFALATLNIDSSTNDMFSSGWVKLIGCLRGMVGWQM